MNHTIYTACAALLILWGIQVTIGTFALSPLNGLILAGMGVYLLAYRKEGKESRS